MRRASLGVGAEEKRKNLLFPERLCLRGGKSSMMWHSRKKQENLASSGLRGRRQRACPLESVTLRGETENTHRRANPPHASHM